MGNGLNSLRNDELRFKLGLKEISLLEEAKIKENPHFSRLADFGFNLVSNFTDGTIDFHIASNKEMNALAFYPTKSIVVCRGALNGILRIGKCIVESEIFPEMMGNYLPPEKSEIGAPLGKLRRDLLNPSEDFILDSIQSPWVEDAERLYLFRAITELLFGFLVCHEIGHHFHQHGKKNGREGKHNFDSDEMLGLEFPGSLDKQAIECVADYCGFDVLLHSMREVLSPPNISDDKYTLFLKNRFFVGPEGLLLRCYQVSFIYFFFMETPGWEEKNAEEWFYPPAGFRLQAIFSSTLSRPPLKLERSRIYVKLEEAIASADEIVRIAFCLSFDIGWFSKMRRYEYHARKVSERMDIWSNEGEAVWEPYLEEKASKHCT